MTFDRRTRALVVLVFVAGCGGGPDVGTVEGTVTLDGEPLANATVTFQPENGRPSIAETDENGHYVHQYTVERAGALVGKHTVRITTHRVHPPSNGQGVREDPEVVPARFNTKSELIREVKSGGNVFDFDLESE